MNEKKQLGVLTKYFRWPMIMLLFLICMNVGVYIQNIPIGIFVSICLLVYSAILFVVYYRYRGRMINEMVDFATDYGQIQKRLIKELQVPYALLDINGDIVWMNNCFAQLVQKDIHYRKSITTIFPDILPDILPRKKDTPPVQRLLQLADRDYQIQLSYIGLDDLGNDNEFAEQSGFQGELVSLYLYDMTDLLNYKRRVDDEKLVVGSVYLDNYDEALETIEEVRRSLLLALLDRRITKYFNGYDGLVRKVDPDKYFVVARAEALRKMEEDKFSLLEDIKRVNIGNDMAVTVSMGFGMGGNYVQNFDHARAAMDIALGRGGDQVVIKNGEDIQYFGGKSKQLEKNTRVKARVKAHALREILEANDKVLVMGHSLGDVDSFGASVGVYCAARTIGKRAYIVINDVTMSVRPLIERFHNTKEYEPDMFIDGNKARTILDDQTVVVVVDVNKPGMCECQQLLTMTPNIVVFDHHRQSNETIKNALLSYIEPYASSACELITEMLQYFDDNVRLRNVEADAIYAGIMIDTNNFMAKAGVRTFEAAAYLRRNGADVTRVRQMFREDMNTYRARAQVIGSSEVYKDCFVLAECKGESLESPTVIGAQAANELLNVIGIRASFVFTPFKSKIYISARSNDSINVQTVMERLGGGGHMNIAAAQLTDCTIEEAKQRVRSVLDEMIEEGEL